MTSVKYFSADEKLALKDEGFFRVKKAVFEKISLLMAQLKDDCTEKINSHPFVPSEAKLQAGKITRGENLDGLPFMVLDFPRSFGNENIFAFRTLFWWGRLISFNMHLGGKFKEQFSEIVIAHLKKDLPNNMWWYHNGYPWNHDFAEENYFLITAKNIDTIKTDNRNFLKVSTKLSLEEVEKFMEEGIKAYENFLKLLNP